MKSLFIILLLACPSSWASIAFVSASSTNCNQTSASAGVACTLTAASTAGNTVIVGLSFKTTTVSLKKLVGSAASSFFVVYSQQKNSTNAAAIIAVCVQCAALTTITPTFSGTTLYELNVSEYSGVSALGITKIATGTSTTPGLTFTTGDANDFIVCETASLGNAGIPTAGTGNLRKANRSGTTSSNVAGALVDNTVAGAGSVTCTSTITSGVWAAAGIELRTTSLKTYIWPDCDTSHWCLIYHYGRPAQPLEADGPLFKFWVRPSLANNLIKLTITHPGTISSIVDAGANTWATGESVTGAGFTTEVRYVCGAAANSGGEIDITLNAAILVGDIMQVEYDEFSGIATSSCSDGTSGATALAQGAIQPGSLTTTVDGDLIYTYGIDGTGNQTNGFPAGWEMADDASTQIWNSMIEAYMAAVTMQTTHGAINPTYYNAGMDINEQNSWQMIAQAFKFSNGAGTQPSSGQAWVVRDIVTWTNASTTLQYTPAPTNGNVIVFATSHPQSTENWTTLKDNVGGTYTSNPITDTTNDPQEYSDCLGTATVTRDRTMAWTITSLGRFVQYYDISGAKTAGGSTGCVGNKANNKTGSQATTACSGVNCANVVTSAFASPFSFTPTINSGATSVVIFVLGFGAGPPSDICNSGGITPPSCTNDMTGFNFGAVFATGMTDASHYTTGDIFGWYATNSASAKSFDFKMANNVDSPGGGSSADAAALEILGEPVAVGACVPTLALMGVGRCG